MSVRLQNCPESQIDQNKSCSRLNAISALLQQLQNRNNIGIIKEIWYYIQDLQSLHNNQVNKLSKELKRGSSFHLALKQSQKLFANLARGFSQVLQELPDRRIQGLYSEVLHLAFKLKHIEPTSIHTHSTRMKQHLLDQLKDEKKKRHELEKGYMAMSQQLQRMSQISQSKIEEKQNMNEEYNRIQSKFVQLTREMNIMKQTSAKLKASNQELRKERHDLNQQLKMSCQLCQSKEAAVKDLNHRLKQTALQLNLATQDRSKSNENQEILKGEMDALQQELNHVRKRLVEATKSDSTLRRRNDELERELDELNTRLRNQQQQLQVTREELDNLALELSQSKKLEGQVEFERQNFAAKTDELESKILELQGQLNELIEAQDNSQKYIDGLRKELDEKEKSANIYMNTAEKLRKQMSLMKRRHGDVIDQKPDDASEQGRSIANYGSPLDRSPKSSTTIIPEAKKSLFSPPRERDLLQETNKRSAPETQIVEDELLRMLLSQALSLQSFIDRD